MKNKFFIFLIISALFLFAIIYYSESASSFTGTTSSYTANSKADIVTSQSSNSSSFTQRFIGGIQAVASYFSNLFTGRFGVLEDSTTNTIISQCTNLTSGNTIYILNTSVNSSGTCFNILVNSITLDCNGTNINYSQTANGYGIASNGYNNTVIKNCNISQGSNTRTNSYSIYFQNGMNSTFSNNRIITYGSTSSSARNYNIFLVNYRNNTLSGNIFNTHGRDSYSVYLSNSGNNTIYANNISTTATGGYGIHLLGGGSSGNNLTLNNITVYGSTTTAGGGIFISTNVFYTNVANNNITVNGSSSYGIYLLSGSKFNNLSRNTVSLLGTSSEAIRMHSGISNTSIIDNNITATATGSLGFDLTSNTNENKIINNTVASNSYSLRIISGNNNFIYNNIFNSTTNNLVSMSSVSSYVNKLNTTKTATTNIVNGNNIGGNYWAKSSGTGFSQTCTDANLDGICDSTYVLNAFNRDYLPLVRTDATAPSINLFSPINASFVNGLVILRAIAYDGQSNSAEDVKHYFIDRTIPIIHDMSVIYPSGQESVKSGQNVTLSVTVTDSPNISAGIDYVQANLTKLNSTDMTNISIYSGSKAPLQNSTWRLNVSITAGTTGTATPEVSVFDAASPSHNSKGGLWQVIIDNTAPTYSGLSSSNQIYNNTIASFVVSAADTIALDHYIFTQNSTGSWVNDTNVLINGTSYFIEHNKIVYTGNFSYRFYIYDDAGNFVQTDIGSIEVLGPAPIPAIYLVSPSDGIISNNNSVNFTYYYTSAVVDNCTLNLDSISNETMTSPANDSVFGFSKNLTDGNHFWHVSCIRIEQEGDVNITAEYFSETRSLDIDTIAPLISIVSPENTTYNSSILDFNITINDDPSQCSFSINNAANTTMSLLNLTYAYYLYSGLVEQSHNITFTCNDTANTYNATQLRYFSINFPDLIVNITSPINLQDIIRGNDAVAGEYDLGLVPNSINITARIYDNETGNNITGVTCHFYDNVSYLGDSFTNSTGYCIMNYTKSSKGVGKNSVMVNYTYLADITRATNISQVNLSIIRYVTPVAMTNLRSFGGYFDGDVSILRINITKINETGTYFYDPQNISANATNAAQQPYTGGASYYPNGSTKNITYISQGQFSANQTVNTSFGSFIRWEVTVSDNNFASYLGSAVHADKSVCTPSYSEWSAWSACSAGTQTRSRTDGCGGTEVQTQSCGGDTSCFPAGTKILMSDNSYKNIEDVKVGDYVISYDELSQDKDIGKVLELESPMRDHMCQIIFSDNSILNLTREHPVYTKEGWKAINPEETKKENSLLNTGKLNEGDLVFFSDLVYKQLKRIYCWNETIQTYNLKTIDKFRNFYADDVLVHNKGEGGGCSGTGWSELSEWSACVVSDTYPNGYSSRTRIDSTSCVETEQDTSCACTPNWQCGLFGTCVDGVHERTCNDLAQCDASNLTYTESQSCINGLNVDYTPQELFLNILIGNSVNFQVTASLNGLDALEIKWYLDSVFQSGNSGTSSVSSSFSNSFDNDAQVKAAITSGSQTQEVIWQINALTEEEANELNAKDCTENWYCKWKPCDASGYKYAEKCQDLNLCGTNLNKPYKQVCSCIPEFKCGDWSECQPDYNIQNILIGEATVNGSQQRTCADSKQCENATIENKECNLEIPIKAVTVEYCYEQYIEIYELNPTRLVSRLKESSFENLKRVDIGFTITEFGGYCNYCYDKVKNFDETDVDCGGKNCSLCIAKGKFFDWWYYAKSGLWIILSLLSVYLAYNNRKVLVSLPEKARREATWELKKMEEELTIMKPRQAYGRPRVSIASRILRAISLIGLIPKAVYRKISGIEIRIKLPRIRMGRKERVPTRISVPKERVIVVERRPRMKPIFADLTSKLREWRRKAYYDTSRLEEGLAQRINRKVKEFRKRNSCWY